MQNTGIGIGTAGGEHSGKCLGIVLSAKYSKIDGRNAASQFFSFNILAHTGPTDTGIQISFQGNQAVIFFTAMQNLVLNITGKTHPGIDNTVITTWSRNGGSLPSSSRLGSLKRPHLNISQSLTLENSSILDEGMYDALLMIDPYTHFISHLGCHNNYYSFVANTVGADDTVLAHATLQLKYYGKSMQLTGA